MSAKTPKKTKALQAASSVGVPATPFKAEPKDNMVVAAYQARKEKRPPPCKIKIEKQNGREIQISLAPAVGTHANDETALTVAAARLTATFGEVSLDAANRLLSDVVNGTSIKPKVSDELVNESLALVASIEPRDGTEAMLAVQMVNTHALIAKLQQRMMNSVETLPQQDSNGGLLVRLLRTFTTQMEALKRYRTGGEQRVSVTHQHVTVNADKAAVAVNPLPATEPGGGVTENSEEQPHEQRSADLIDVTDDVPSPFKANR